MDEQSYYLAFSVFPGIGPVRFKALLSVFGTAKEAFIAKERGLSEILDRRVLPEFIRFRSSFSIPDYLQKLHLMGITPVASIEDRYPKLLKEISDPPIVLYVKGKRGKEPINLSKTVGIVGTRKISPYGHDITARLSADLAASSLTIVSGMAMGVDTVAHTSALDAGGSTVAVLGCGVDIIAPSCNASLYQRIIDSGRGAVISEMPIGHRPNKGLFPARNRIISGLSLAVVVTEGADDSGALITARYAAEQGRDVCAVPGPVTSPTSHGPAKLIKNGAALVESANDVLDVLNILPGSGRSVHVDLDGLSQNELVLVRILERIACDIDTLVRESKLTTSTVAATLSILEVKGIIRDTGDKTYVLCK